MKTLYLYTQGEKESVEEYGRNFKSLWDTVEAFGGSPGMHKRLVEGILKDPERVRNVNSITDTECRAVEQEVSNTVKAALVRHGGSVPSERRPRKRRPRARRTRQRWFRWKQ